jgi:glycosyltransferase involved in cell wall biosynthesis
VRVSFINGVCVRHDAISNAVADEIGWLSAAGADVLLYTYACEQPGIEARIVSGVGAIVADQHFQQSDLIVLHYGITYPLFDAIALKPRRARALVVFHNITPPELLPPSARVTIEKSFRQLSNLGFADYVACDSGTNLDVLRAHGVKTPARVLSLALHSDVTAPFAKPSFSGGPVRILFIGRFVRSKGARDLIAAATAAAARQTDAPGIRVDLVGNTKFSDPDYLAQTRKEAEDAERRSGRRLAFFFHGDANDDDKRRLLADADIFALPTYHEGFCVPILEALGSGCAVVSYDNSNVPAISGGFARLAPTGDHSALSAQLIDAISEVSAPAWRATSNGYQRFRRRTADYVSSFNMDNTRHRFLSCIKDLRR